MEKNIYNYKTSIKKGAGDSDPQENSALILYTGDIVQKKTIFFKNQRKFRKFRKKREHPLKKYKLKRVKKYI